MGWEIFGPPVPRKPLLPTLGAPTNPESGYGPWEATASPLVQRRRKPDGSYETRATPGAIPGGKPASKPEPKPREPHPLNILDPDSGIRRAGNQVRLGMVEGADFFANLPETISRGVMTPVFELDKLRERVDRREAEDLGSNVPVRPAARMSPPEGLSAYGLPEIVDETLQNSRDEREAVQEDALARAVNSGASPVGAAVRAELPRLAGNFLDPTSLGLVGKGGAAFRAARGPDLFEGVAFRALEPSDLQAAVAKGVAPVSPGYGGQAEAVRFAAWLDKHGLDYDAAERFGELPWLREKFFNLDNPDVTPPPSFYGAKPGESGQITFGRDPDPDVDLGAMEAPELPPPPAGPVRDPRMSTKALENVAGMQDEFAGLLADNYDVVAKGRGPVRPVSVYHDANALADDLGMTREDFLEIAPRIGDKEVSLGKAFMAGAKQEINDLARQLADGSAADPVAAKARLDQLSVDVVRMMANIQGRFSEGGRVLRSGQEALDPFNLAATPKEKLQLGLLKRYGVANREAAEAKAERVVKGLERQIRDLEARLKSGPQLPQKAAPVTSPQIDALRAQVSDLRAQIMKDPREALVRRYREALDEETVRMIAQLPDDPRSPDMLNFLRKMERPTFKDYRMSYWINSVLSGTKTTLRNLNGNVVQLAELTAMRLPGAVFEAGLAPLQGRAPERLLRETLPATMGVFRGVPEGLKRFAFVMKNGYDPERLVAELTEGAGKKFDGRLPVDPFTLSQSPAVRKVGAVVTLPTRLLAATDALFKTMASTSENYAWATRKAIQEGADDVPGRVAELVLEQPEEMVRAARAFAEKATFQDPMSWVGSAAASLRRGPPGTDKLVNALEDRGGAGRALVPLLRAPQTVMEHLVPFIHVSDRVAATVTNYIPGSKPRKLAYLLATKDPEAADLLARQVVGAGLGMLGLKWAAEGRLVGAAPKDEALRNDFYSEGKQPYSLLIGGRWVPIRDTLGPLAGPFVAAALYQDHVQAGEDPVPATVGMTLSSARYMLDASYMSTLQDVIEAIETDNSGEVGRGMTQAAARVVGGYNPYSGLQRNVATALDPRVVERESFTDELKSGVPGLRSELPARIGPRGEELTQVTGALGGMSPVVPTRNRVADPELAERVERLRYTLQGMRRQYGRTERAIEDAKRGETGEAGLSGKDQELRLRGAALRDQLPTMAEPTKSIDKTMDEVRALEQTIREVRADSRKSPQQRREEEIHWQRRIEKLLADEIQRGAVQ